MKTTKPITITLTRKEAECLIWIADYGINDDVGDNTPWNKEDKKAIEYGTRATGKIWAALKSTE
jgi:hypothetical protein